MKTGVLLYLSVSYGRNQVFVPSRQGDTEHQKHLQVSTPNYSLRTLCIGECLLFPSPWSTQDSAVESELQAVAWRCLWVAFLVAVGEMSFCAAYVNEFVVRGWYLLDVTQRASIHPFFRMIGGKTLSLLSLAWSEWTCCPCLVCSTQWRQCSLINDGVLCQ